MSIIEKVKEGGAVVQLLFWAASLLVLLGGTYATFGTRMTNIEHASEATNRRVDKVENTVSDIKDLAVEIRTDVRWLKERK
jgi:archaellum component FlaF (FlaF/FlaG flagellin family)